MIFTARQIEDLFKASGQVRLPVGARLTPLANDWLKQRQIRVVYGSDAPASPGASSASRARSSPAGSGLILSWCDGPCGQAKAALAAQARESNLQAMSIPEEPRQLVAAIKHLAKEIKNDRAAMGVLVVQSGAPAVVYGNRCPSLRAIIGTCRDSVQQGVEQLAANVLIIEHPYQSLQQVRNLLSQFVRIRRELSDDVRRQLKDLTTCE